MGLDYKKKYLKYKNKYLEAKKIYGGAALPGAALPGAALDGAAAVGAAGAAGVDDFSKKPLLEKIKELEGIIQEITTIGEEEQLNIKLSEALNECKRCSDPKQQDEQIATLKAQLEKLEADNA